VSAVAPVTLVVGTEGIFIDRAVGEIVAAVRAGEPMAERRVIDASSEDAAAELAEAVAPTLFGDASIVVIDSADSLDDAGIAALRDLIAAPVDGIACVVLHEGKGNKGKKVLTALREAGVPEVSCPALRKGRDTMSFLTGEVRRHGRKATPDALRVLYDAIGHDPRALAGAVDQLCVDVEGDPIDEEMSRASRSPMRSGRGARPRLSGICAGSCRPRAEPPSGLPSLRPWPSGCVPSRVSRGCRAG
jgi:DNA polymerase-3 subunit delta